jgi:hypothetical protein
MKIYLNHYFKSKTSLNDVKAISDFAGPFPSFKKNFKTMKRLLIVTTILGSATASNSFAKTEGSYLGIDALSVRTSYYPRAESYNKGEKNYKPTQYGSTYGVGVHYGYAVNSNNFFIIFTVFLFRLFNKIIWNCIIIIPSKNKSYIFYI